MKECWKDIFGYEGLYQVSNMRRVKSLNYRHAGQEGFLKRQKNNDGYLIVRLCKDGEYKGYQIHRLVAQTFIPNPKNYPEVNHKDETPSNNCVENLEWCSRQYNINYGHRTEKTSKPVVCVETGEIFNSIKEAQEKTGIDASSISKCARRVKWYPRARRFHWEFV